MNKAENRAHILEGFKIALDNIEEVIKIIRGSWDANIAKEELMKILDFSEFKPNRFDMTAKADRTWEWTNWTRIQRVAIVNRGVEIYIGRWQ